MTIQSFDDLDLKSEDTPDQFDAKLQEKLGVKISDLQQALCSYVQSHAEEMSLQFKNIAPLGDYGELIEERDDMIAWLKSEAIKPEHWKLHWIDEHKVHKNLLQFIFHCEAIDNGNTCKGHAFVSFSGKLRHVFAQGEDNV